MGSGGKCFELFLGQLGIGNGQEILIDFGLPAEVAKSQNSVGKRRNLGHDREVSDDQQEEDKPFWQ